MEIKFHSKTVEIKVRAWDTERKKYWSPQEMGKDQLTLMPDGQGFINVSGISTSLSHLCPHLIPELCTGLKDQNGKEGYLNDIIAELSFEPKRYYLIEWNICNACFELRSMDAQKEVMPINDLLVAKIIGNVHENPDLLEQTNGD